MFYITTTLPYVNAQPHIGFGLEIVAADVIARWQRMRGEAVIFNTGTDEHGQKIYQEAVAANLDPQAYTDQNAAYFRQLVSELDLEEVRFIRTTDPQHVAAAQEFWRRCAANVDPETGLADIYKDTQEIHYCVGCELEKQASELEDGRCPLHPNKTLETRTEENYFFRFSRYQSALLELYQSQPTFVQPSTKLNEIQAFVAGGLKDFSISRLKAKMPWGVPVPDDDQHVFYVWFDALVNYISTLGWPESGADSEFTQFWPGVQVAGKDNLRQQSAMWQAMLLSAGEVPSQQILINGFISIDGQKMSKSLGNVIAPAQMVTRYGSDATRFLLMQLGPFGTDMDASWEKFDTQYTAVLANSIGNTCSRISAMARGMSTVAIEPLFLSGFSVDTLEAALNSLALSESVGLLVAYFDDLERFIHERQPWKLDGAEKTAVLTESIAALKAITPYLGLILPKTAQQLDQHFVSTTLPKLPPLFPRLPE